MSRKLIEKANTLLAAEKGTVYKNDDPEVRVALAYPNTYHVGMSNLGIHQIYAHLNKRPDTVCERVFLPDKEDMAEYAASKTLLFSLESKRLVKGFDILAFSISFELDYLHVLTMLHLSGIPVLKRERTHHDPLIIFGGACSFFNPEPLANFFDAVIVGEGEEVIGKCINAFKRERKKTRLELLQSISTIPGVYVPEFYDIQYHSDGTIKARVKREPSAPDRIIKRTVRNFDTLSAATAILTPNTEFSNMYLTEIMRGCNRHCRFCLAGSIYLPPRTLGIEAAKKHAQKADALCGKTGLVGAAISDYPFMQELCSSIRGAVSVSSLRADALHKKLLARLAKSGHKTIALAPEAGSERLRKVINKGITEEDILDAVNKVFEAGIPNLKLYFIIGLPTETQEDIEAIPALAACVHDIQLQHARQRGRIGKITLSVNAFVPKPFTPFQWEPMDSILSLNRKLRFLSRAVKKIGNTDLIHDLPKRDYLQAFLSNGDRRAGSVLYAAHKNGGSWRKAARIAAVDIDFFAHRRRGFDEVLPWDFIDIGMRKEYLKNEYDRARNGIFTPPCSVGSCTACGVCETRTTDEH
ncbi:MAG: TIGR03960 family B12-binding radical SAM protein [Nitrospirota bacterium]